MKVRIEIDTQTFVRFWLVVIGFALAALAIYSARTALIILGVAFFLALALNRPVTKLASFLPGHSRVGGTALAFVAVVAVLGLGIFAVIPPIVQQSLKFTDTVPGLVATATEQWHGLDTVIEKYNLQPQVDNAVESAKNNATRWAASIGSNILSSLSAMAAFLTSAFLTLVLAFLMLIEGPAWIKRMWRLYDDPDRMENHKEVAAKMYNVVTGYVTGQLTVSAIGAVCAGLVVFVLSFFFKDLDPSLAMPAAAMTFILSLVPMFGATIAGVLITLLLILNSFPAAIIFLVYFVLYQQFENNFVSPKVQSKAVELSALAVLASVTIGLYVFGVAGGIISIPIAGCIKVLLENYLDRAKKKRHKKEKPFNKLVKKVQRET
jgi:predicted PurR-regulated permease PerM